jgi:cytochrome c
MRLAPPLEDVYNRRVAATPGFAYSESLARQTFMWTSAALNQWLEGPSAFVPGTRMTFPGISDRSRRTAVIGVLRHAKALCANSG